MKTNTNNTTLPKTTFTSKYLVTVPDTTPVDFLDAHTAPPRRTQCDGVIRYTREDGRVYFCPLYRGGWFCLNKFTSKDGGLRLSPISVGRTLSPADVLKLLHEGELRIHGGCLQISTEAEALKYLESAKTVNKILRDIENHFDIDLHQFKR